MSKPWLNRNPFSTSSRTDAVAPVGEVEQVRADEVSFDAAESGRHRGAAFAKHPATLVTASITAASLALAGYAAYGSEGLSDEQIASHLADGAPALGDSATNGLEGSGSLAQISDRSQSMDEAVAGVTSAQSSREAGAEGSAAISERVAELKAEEEAAEKAAAKAEAERKAEAEAERQAEAQAETEAQAEAESAAAAPERDENQAASRSQERESAPAEEPAEPAEPAAAPAPSGDSRSIARSMVASRGWSSEQFGCLDSLWAKESGWNHTASNPSSGAYGIPQSLPGSKMASAGSDWRTNPATQISWGLGYIQDRYGSPCAAWSHSQANNWY